MDGRNQMTTSFWLLVLAVVGCYTCCLFLCIVVSKMPHVVAIRIFRAPCACVWCCCYPVCARYINIKVSILHRLSVVTRFVQQGGSDWGLYQWHSFVCPRSQTGGLSTMHISEIGEIVVGGPNNHQPANRSRQRRLRWTLHYSVLAVLQIHRRVSMQLTLTSCQFGRVQVIKRTHHTVRFKRFTHHFPRSDIINPSTATTV